MKRIVPEQVTAALLVWHNAAVQFDPNNPSESVSLRSRAAWLDFENECLKWEQEERAHHGVGVFGPTGAGKA